MDLKEYLERLNIYSPQLDQLNAESKTLFQKFNVDTMKFYDAFYCRFIESLEIEWRNVLGNISDVLWESTLQPVRQSAFFELSFKAISDKLSPINVINTEVEAISFPEIKFLPLVHLNTLFFANSIFRKLSMDIEDFKLTFYQEYIKNIKYEFCRKVRNNNIEIKYSDCEYFIAELAYISYNSALINVFNNLNRSVEIIK
jgi:hypothetical protein